MSEGLEAVVAALAGHLPRLYAVVDPARDPEVLKWLHQARIPFQCLFQGEKAKSLAEEAPYLVHFGQDAGVLRELVEAHHDDGVATYLVSDAPFYAVRRHLRRIQMIRTEDGDTLYFRYYDPRVARVFLPTCDNEQIRWMFGKVVERWLTEAVERSHLVEHYVAGQEGDALLGVRFDQVA